MADVIVRQLEEFKKEYATPRKTVITEAEAVVLEEKKAEAFPVVFLMDRFGYARTIEESIYEKNREAADEENRIVLHCMSDSRLCIFTDTGRQHILKVEKVPHGRFRDKGTPIDNLCNYDSSEETYLQVYSLDEIKTQKLIFTTAHGFVKTVEGSEFDVAKLTIAATKLEEGDRLIDVHPVHYQASMIIATRNHYLLRMPEESIPVQKKAARGVYGIRLTAGDEVEKVFYLEDGAPVEVEIAGKMVSLNRLHIAERGGKGTKLRK